MSNLSVTSFSLENQKGRITADPGFNSLAVKVDDSEADPIVPGEALKFNAAEGDLPVVTAVTATTDTIVGFMPYDVARGTTGAEAGQVAKSSGNGIIMIMEAAGAINRETDSLLEYVPTGQKVQPQNTGTAIGRPLDNAAADGDLIRVEIKVL